MKLNGVDFCFATFCFGDRYYKQVNRYIESINNLLIKPEIFIVTDKPEEITKYDFVNIKNINEYDIKYNDYKKNYYDFDFSVKRFSLLYSFEMGYNNVIFTDADAIVNNNSFSVNKIMKLFSLNTIGGPVSYDFNNEILSSSLLGQRFLYYEKKYNVVFDKKNLRNMVEDCILYISIADELKFKFIDVWNNCIKIKDDNKLLNIPAGNIDEICFSSKYNNINLQNIGYKYNNMIYAQHDKWY